MENNVPLRRMAAWLAILALPLAFANVGLALAAINFDLAGFGNMAYGVELVAAHPLGVELTRWSMIADMLGFYLMLIPVALVLRNWLKEHNRLWVNLVTLFGLGYLFFGAMGAAMLSAVLPNQLYAYAQSAAATAETHKAIFLAFTDAIYNGVWGTLDPILGGVWWVGLGIFLRRERRALGWVTLVLGAFMLLRDVKIGPLEMVGLAAYFVLAPIWAAWLGVDLLRQPAKE